MSSIMQAHTTEFSYDMYWLFMHGCSNIHMPLFIHCGPKLCKFKLLQEAFLRTLEVNMDECLKGLVKRENFESTFRKDVYFYILVIHRAKRYVS